MSKPQMKKSAVNVSADLVMKDLWAARRTLALVAAIDLDLFSVIAGGKTTASAIASAVKSPVHGVEHLLDALVGMGYLTKRTTKYSLTPTADAFLVRDRHTYLGAFAEESKMTLPGWMQLGEVIRSGSPLRRVDTAEGREFFPKLVRAIFPMMYGSARRLRRLVVALCAGAAQHSRDRDGLSGGNRRCSRVCPAVRRWRSLRLSRGQSA